MKNQWADQKEKIFTPFLRDIGSGCQLGNLSQKKETSKQTRWRSSPLCNPMEDPQKSS